MSMSMPNSGSYSIGCFAYKFVPTFATHRGGKRICGAYARSRWSCFPGDSMCISTSPDSGERSCMSSYHWRKIHRRRQRIRKLWRWLGPLAWSNDDGDVRSANIRTCPHPFYVGTNILTAASFSVSPICDMGSRCSGRSSAK